jgi:hypothetical protein
MRNTIAAALFVNQQTVSTRSWRAKAQFSDMVANRAHLPAASRAGDAQNYVELLARVPQ